MTGIEGVGEAVTGGMIAREVEPEHGEAAERESVCLNCGAGLAGSYCHQCGQKGHVHRTLRGFGHDLVHGVLHFEGKIWRTLPMLAWRPGELTRRYVEGERAKFVSPIALFLFSVFLMFAVFSLIGGPLTFDSGRGAGQTRAEAEADFREEQAEDRARLEELRAERRRLAEAGRPTAEADSDISRLETEMALQERLFQETLNLVAGQESAAQTKAGAAAMPEAAPKAETAVADADLSDALAPVRSLDAAWRKAKENPELLAYKLQTNAYKFSWALIPISVPFLWMLFLHRRRYRRHKAYDHVVFVTYSIAFMSLGLIALSLLRPLGVPTAVTALAILLVPPVHMYRQLRGAYRLSRLSALWRTAVLLMFAFIAGIIFFALLVAMGALG